MWHELLKPVTLLHIDTQDKFFGWELSMLFTESMQILLSCVAALRMRHRKWSARQ